MSADSLNEQVFRLFEGKWSVHRVFEGSQAELFEGEANFARMAESMPAYIYFEEGKLIDGEGQCFVAKQSYRYRLSESLLQVLKNEEGDWSVMHELDFALDDGIATASHVHLCGEDHYATLYRVDLSGGWEVSYTVNGPKKDYRIRSVYTRA